MDALTQLGDRLQMEVELEGHINQGTSVALAVIDVDNFFRINDEISHEKGDAVLHTLAGILQSAAAPYHAYRVSGDEFAVVLPHVTLEQAFQERDAFALPSIDVTISVGVAQYPRDAKDLSSLRQSAGAAVWAAKEAGRNSLGLPPNEEMVMKSCYYNSTSVRRLRLLAEKTGQKESALLREGLDDLLRKYDRG